MSRNSNEDAVGNCGCIVAWICLVLVGNIYSHWDVIIDFLSNHIIGCIIVAVVICGLIQAIVDERREKATVRKAEEAKRAEAVRKAKEEQQAKAAREAEEAAARQAEEAVRRAEEAKSEEKRFLRCLSRCLQNWRRPMAGLTQKRSRWRKRFLTGLDSHCEGGGFVQTPLIQPKTIPGQSIGMQSNLEIRFQMSKSVSSSMNFFGMWHVPMGGCIRQKKRCYETSVVTCIFQIHILTSITGDAKVLSWKATNEMQEEGSKNLHDGKETVVLRT